MVEAWGEKPWSSKPPCQDIIIPRIISAVINAAVTDSQNMCMCVCIHAFVTVYTAVKERKRNKERKRVRLMSDKNTRQTFCHENETKKTILNASFKKSHSD